MFEPISRRRSPDGVLRRTVPAGVCLALTMAAAGAAGCAQVGWGAESNGSARPETAATAVTRRDFVRSIRLNGTMEAVQATTIAAPRIAGPNSNSLVITYLLAGGTRVVSGDLLVVFDRQAQLQTALDRRAELNDLEQQIRRKEAEERAAAARDDSELQQAQSAIDRAKLEMVKNEMLPKIQAEKNRLALEQADAHLQQLKTTYASKRRAAKADVAVLQIRLEKARSAMEQAESNARQMEVRSPLAGLAVIRTRWKPGGPSEILEGEEVRPGMPIVDVVNTERMRARLRVNQVDVNELRTGQPVRVGLDGYPDLSFSGRIAQISPLGVTSSLNPKVRQFIVLVDVDGSHPNLMPDLTASLDVELERVRGAMIVPRHAIRYDGGKAYVRVKRGDRFEDRLVTVGSRSANEAVITSGLDDGATVAHHVSRGGGA